MAKETQPGAALVSWADEDCPVGQFRGRMDLMVGEKIIDSRRVECADDITWYAHELESVAAQHGYSVTVSWLGNPRK